VSGISRIMIGGEHERWEVPARVKAEEELGWDSDGDGRPKKEHGQAPKVCYLAELAAQDFNRKPGVCCNSQHVTTFLYASTAFIRSPGTQPDPAVKAWPRIGTNPPADLPTYRSEPSQQCCMCTVSTC